MSLRTAVGLHLAGTCAPPKFVDPKQRRRGAKLAGLRYERAVAKAIPGAQPGVWFEFWDRQGHGYCQPDILLPLGRTLFIIEVKYTWVPEAKAKLEGLYCPVVGKAFQVKPHGLIVCRRLVPEAPSADVVCSLAEALALALAGRTPILHWLGHSRVLLDPSEGPSLAQRA